MDHSHRYKRLIITHSHCGPPSAKPKKTGKAKIYGGSFDMDIDVPVSAHDPTSPGNMTVTGWIIFKDNVTISAKYTNSMFIDTQINPGTLTAGVVFAGQQSPYTWSLTFPTPTTSDTYTFTIQGTYSDPAGGIIGPTTTITLSASFDVP